MGSYDRRIGQLALATCHLYDIQGSAWDRMTDALVSLHWLHVIYMTFKVLHGIAPEYLGPVVRAADLCGRKTLRSVRTYCLVVPPFKLSTISSLAFPVAGHQAWNGPPEDLTAAPSLSTFCQILKTNLF